MTKIVALALPAIFLVLLLLVLFQPFHHPRAHFFTLTDSHANSANGDLSLYAPIQRFEVEDLKAFDALAPLLYQDESHQGPISIDSLQESGIHALGELLFRQNVDPDDNLLLYIRAEGSTVGEEAFLVWSFEPERIPLGRFRLRDLLSQLAEFPAAVKIVLLDAGELTHDPRLGMVVNAFPDLLRAEVERTGDSHLWVLCSHRMLEKSQGSLSKSRTLFGMYVARGLQGEADLNADQSVDLDELYRFVSASVQMHVREKSDGNDSQTPELIWGGEKSGSRIKAGEWPALVPVVESLVETEAREESAEDEKTPSRKGAFEKAARLSPLRPATPSVSSTISRVTPAAPTFPRIPGPVPGATPAVQSASGLTAQIEQSAVNQIQQASHAKAAPTEAAIPASPSAEAKSTTPSAAAVPAIPPQQEGSLQPGESTPQTIPELFSKVWELRDRLSDHESSVPRPLDYAPHLWRAFEEQIIAQERLYFAGAIGDQKRIAKGLALWVMSLDRFAENRADLPADAPELVRRMLALAPKNPLADERVYSLGMLELRGRLAREELTPEMQSVIQSLDQFTEQGTPAEFVKWLDGLPEINQRFLEMRLAYRLRNRADRDWSLVQLALKARRRAEQVPTQELWAQAWVGQHMARGDRDRLAGERELLDQASRDWKSRSQERLQSALAEYESASRDVRTLQTARMVRNDLLHRLPAYVKWWHAAGDSSGPSSVAPGATQLATLMSLLQRQSELLESPASENVPEIARLHRQLEQLQRQIEAPLQKEFVSGLVQGPAANGDEWRIRVLLETPLPNRETRMQLLGALEPVDEQLESRLSRISIPEKLPRGKLLFNAADWERLARRSELDTRLAELAALHPADDAGASQRVREAFATLEKLREEAGRGDSPRDANLFQAFAELGLVLRNFYSTLPGRIGAAYRHNDNLGNEAMRTMCLCALRATERSIRLMDPRDVLKAADHDPIGLLRRAEAADLLAWQYDRLNKTRDDADAIEAEYLAATAQIYRNELSGLPGSLPNLVLPSPLELTADSQLLLPTEGVAELAVDLHWKGLSPAEVWLLLKYDAELMDVMGNSEIPFYREDQLREQGLNYPARPADKSLPRTIALQPGESKKLRFRIQAKTQAAEPAPLIFKAVTQDQYIRRATQVTLPFPELFQIQIGGTPGSWSTTAQGFVLYPYPNQETSFQLRISNEEALPREVDVELSALEQAAPVRLPRVALSSAAAADWLARLGPRTPLAGVTKLSVPANGQPVEMPFPADTVPAEESAALPESASPPNEGEAVPAKDGKSPANTPPAIRIPQDLLLTVTDNSTGRKIFKRIQLAPQRPRRYLRARVGYNLERERIEVRVEMKDKTAFSPHGVRIAGELAEGLQPGWTAQLAGRLQSPADVARLFVNVPEEQGRAVTLRLHADGYPRAFVFRVPCDADSDDLPEETALHEVRILSPAEGSAFPVPTESVPAVFQVDAPLGAFQTGDDIVQVGIDKDRDRTFLGDAPLRFQSDRQVKNRWIKAGPGGWITLAAAVEDFQVDVPTWGLENAEVNLLGNMITATKTSWSLPRKLVFDGVGPRLVRPELNSGDATIGNVVTQGKDAVVSVRAGDFAKSGVVKVEAAFDPLGLGRFGDAPAPVQAKLGQNERWTAPLATGELKPGTYAVIFQGTDRVGNKGDYVSTTVQIVSPEEAATRKTERTNLLTGIIFDGKTPAAKIKVTLTPELSKEELQKLEAEKKKPIAIPPTVTDDEGKFVFSQVQIGDYKLTIEGITRGLRRQQETTITIPPPPSRLKPLELRIDKPPAP